MTGARVRLPAAIAQRARDLAAGSSEPADPKDAATVVLLRAVPADPGRTPAASSNTARPPPASPPRAPAGPAPAQAAAPQAAPRRLDARPGFEVYLLRRRRSMAFAPGAYVFPGGSVEARDADPDLAWAGPDSDAWGAALRCTAALARALVCAAVRETFEESGVLLAGPTAATTVADTGADDWEADRRALIDGSLSLAAMLRRRALVVRSDLLTPWARWITPEPESRRFDARFFAARLPEGQRARDVGGEADEVAWLTPADAIAAARRGELSLMPPTAVTLAELARLGGLAAALTVHGDMRPRQPGIVLAADAAWLTIPDGLEYPL